MSFLSRTASIGLRVIPLLAALLLAAGCESSGSGSPTNAPTEQSGQDVGKAVSPAPALADDSVPAMGESSGVFYEIFVRSFSDSNGDGIGDLQGVTNKLDYLKDLGIKGIWLMPIQPTPSYHGYDVTDYYNVNPQYGTIEDLKLLIEEAHKRDIKVIMDLVLNHSSTQHPWFVDSASGKDSAYRDWYVWAEDQGKNTSEMGALGYKAWHELGGSHYLGVFWDGMPDLNFDNPAVREEFLNVGEFWLNQGLDGFRLDGAKHVYEDLSSSIGNAEVVRKNQEWWQQFRKGMEEVKQDVYLVGEVWDSRSVIGPFLNKGFDSAFNFDLAKLLISSIRTEKASSIASTLSTTYQYYSEQSGGSFVDAPFLSNHDQNRIMSEVMGNTDQAKMGASLLLTLPGNPFLYYGEEIGMKGTKPDEEIREPMSWSEAGSAEGETSWEESKNKAAGASVEAQQNDPDSLLNHYKKMISWRSQEPILANGGIVPYESGNNKLLTFLRVQENQKALVVHNLSKTEQILDLGANGDHPYRSIALSSKEGATLNGNELSLPPYSTVLLK